ncbi:Glycyl-glycine endopeptidase ALE-1 precursor [Legionella massiliensis]|uniref:Glycyl-glycine endopeptidase ALE-1 n=1 Tax=Legionella massiliensis TaxID=1034943 RepID=A0A078KVE7_9GAMM|nr:peptidoglycan DD-metalloendopeptidase family protein [Legionella massiliensis]CDZ75744.1 Glycyl-glycine endopeptidase ALE-1 precursor [Legionella massiliensis]CEE11482.1 Murein DD-endopeptidase MepM [Legionella massiliensis]
MDQRPNVSLENSSKPSKVMALIALVIAIALPFILVKSFPNKQKANYDAEQAQAAEELQETLLPTPEVTESVKQRPDTSISEHSLAAAKTRPAGESKKDRVATATTASPRTTTASAVKEKIQTESKQAKTKVVVERDSGPKTLVTRRRDSLAAVFSRIGLNRQLLQTITKENPRIKSLTRLRPNEKLEYHIKNRTLEKMNIPYSNTQSLVLYRDGQHYRTKINPYKITSQNHHVTATVRGSLYTTAKRYNISYKLIQQMTEILAWDINFAKDIRANDQFTIVYRTTMANDRVIGTGEIVAVSYRNRGKTFQAVLHTSRSGRSDYYSPKGNSLKNAFNRYPLRFTHISSTFSAARNHPILRYKRPHKGVDLAAPIGTPIMATGDGRIEIIGRQSGYGNMIKIKHNNTYNTIYGHMLRFQKGLSKGTYVKKGQIIGYVGQSGLATGPHCHYEFHINQNPKNPTTVDLPRGDSVPAREMASFRANSNKLLSLIKSLESGHFAKANRKGTRVG